MLNPKKSDIPTTKVLREFHASLNISSRPLHTMKLPAKISAPPKTGLGIIVKIVKTFGKKARARKITPAQTQIHRLTTFVAPATPILLDEVSTAIPPINPASKV
ncbi:MAG: hypothetical protein RBR01_08220, partial [Desulfobacterales bacterium]|nr:hypothetical protein [Desulfobacterales bacterium]